METNLSLGMAFIAGLLSFVSPCVLPLLSSYLVFIGGSAAGANAPPPSRRRALISTLSFVFGFSAVFVVLSVLLYGVFAFTGGVHRILGIAAGAVVIVLGLNILFNFIPFLKYDDRSERCETCTPKHSILAVAGGSLTHPSRRPRGLLGPFIVGVAFGAGWTPCVGAFLGSILLLAGQSGALALSVLYLAAYSAGLGLPFIIASIFWDAAAAAFGRFRRVMPVVRVISGLFLTGVGALMLAGKLFVLNAFFQRSGMALAEFAETGSFGVPFIATVLSAVARWLNYAGM